MSYSNQTNTLIDIDNNSSGGYNTSSNTRGGGGGGFDFQSFPPLNENTSPYNTTTVDSPIRNTQRDNNVDGDGFNNEGGNKYSIWSIEYFQRFFNVDTDTVVDRIKASIYPKYGINYLQTHIQSKPDLYGPFWICVTLIFTIAISGNIANYLQSAASHTAYHWKYDFHAVSTSATAIFSYAWLLPICIWAYLKYQNDPEVVNLSILELLCVYGYSLSIYIPISILWVIQVGFLQVTLVLVGAVLSGYVLITSLTPAFRQPNIIALVVLSALHFLLALGLMLYFFHVPPLPESIVTATSTIVSQVVTKSSNITH